MKIAVFASGRGTNLQAIIRAVKKGRLKAEIALVVSDNKHAYALKRSQKAGIRTLVVDPQDYPAAHLQEAKIIEELEKEGIALLVLAGYMRMLSEDFVKRYPNRIMNIHPALLPAFKGSHAIKDAFDYGVKVTGVTVHFVDEKMDHGPIILQQAVPVRQEDTLASLEKKIHRIEHKLYPEAIRLFCEGKLRIEQRKVMLV